MPEWNGRIKSFRGPWQKPGAERMGALVDCVVKFSDHQGESFIGHSVSWLRSKGHIHSHNEADARAILSYIG